MCVRSTGAQVQVLYSTASTLAGKAAGDKAAEGLTKKDGTFAVGPLPGDATYSVSVEKTGHVLQQEGEAQGGSFTFSSKQLAQVIGCT